MYHYEKRPYFEGWYIKQRSGEQSIAFIPAYHIDRKGHASASLQIITAENSWNIVFSAAETEIYGGKTEFYARMGKCIFTERECWLQIHSKELQLQGRLNYDYHRRLKYDMMGPFQYVPGMQCRHFVCSLKHRVNGRLSLNGKEYNFRNGVGYMEGDKGISFPQKYVWTQYNNCNICIMMAAASVPVLGYNFHGCIGVIWVKGKEYRLATYLGARVIYSDNKKIVIRQWDLTLTAELLNENSHILHAPCEGEMHRIIHENIACKVNYQFTKGGQTLLNFTSKYASFETESAGV